MYYDNNGNKEYYVNLHTKTILNESDMKTSILCINEGILHSELHKKIKDYFHDQNYVQCIQKYDDRYIFVTDTIGTIKIFDIHEENGSYVHVSSQHLGNIHICKLFPNNKILLTSSKNDRSLFVWTIKHNE